MEQIIELRIIGFNLDGNFQFICLETDIAISSETLHGAKEKMRDALLSYFQSFSKKEIETNAFMRRAPLKYSVLWYLLSIAGFIKNLTFFFSSKVDYDPNSQNLKLA